MSESELHFGELGAAAAPKRAKKPRAKPVPAPDTRPGYHTTDEPGTPSGYHTDEPDTPAPAPVAASSDPFDLTNLAAPQHIQHAREIVTSELVTIGRPAPDRAFRVHPGPEWDNMLAVLSLSAVPSSGARRSVVGGEKYLLTATVAAELEQTRPGTVRWRRMCYWLDDCGALGLWPVAAGGNSGNENAWVRSALACVAAARGQWVRVTSDVGAGKFRCYRASKTEPPAFPAWSMSDVLRRAFGENLVTTTEHAALAHMAGDEIATGT
jgi:hypothetical protein